jgi:hypothetical protein
MVMILVFMYFHINYVLMVTSTSSFAAFRYYTLKLLSFNYNFTKVVNDSVDLLSCAYLHV